MADTKSIEAILSARDQNFTSVMNKAMGTMKSFGKTVAGGVGLGSFMAIGQRAVGAVSSGFRSLLGDMDKTNAAWTSFSSNMKAAGHSTGEINKAKKAMQDFASKSIYYSSDMASTYAQLDAVGTKGTTNLVKGFGAVASASENPTQAMKSMSQQATQMAAKPMVAWQDFKIMMEQTPAGIAQVAKEMGMSTKELVSSVQDGSVKTKDFFAAIGKIGGNANHQLMKNATQYKTIGEAISGTSGYLMTKLAPAWEVVSKAAISALGSIQGRIGKLDSKAIAEKVSSGIKKAKEIFNEAKPYVKAFGSATLSTGRAVASVLPYLAKLAPVLVPALAAYKGFKKASGIAAMFKGIANGTKLLTTFTKESGDMISIMQKAQLGAGSTTGAFAGLKTALAGIASPAGLAVAGVAGVTAGIAMLQSHLSKIPGTWQNAKNASDEASASLRETTKSYEELKTASQEQANEQLAEVAHTQELKKELDGIVDSNGKVKKGYGQRADAIVNAISKATGIEMEYTNGVVKGYEKAGDAVDKYVEKKRAQIMMEANEGVYKKAIQGQQKAQEAMNKAQKEMANANKNLLSGDLGAGVKYQKAKEEYAKYTKDVMVQENAMREFERGNYEKAEQILNNHILTRKQQEQLELQNSKAVHAAELQQQVAQNEKIAQTIGEGLNVEQALNQIITKANQKGVEVPKAVANGIRTGQYELPTTVEGMKTLVKFDSLAAKAKKAGVDIPKSIKTGIQSGKMAVPTSVKQLNALIKYQGMVNKAKKAGVDIPNKITSGIASGKMKPTEAVKAMNALVANKAKEGTTKVGAEGKKVGSEYSKGAKSSGNKAVSAAGNISKSVISKLKGGASQASSAGRMISTGFAQGMESAASAAEAAAERIVAAAHRAAEAKADIGSPSKLFAKLGRFVTLGFAKGITDNESDAKMAGIGLATAADEGVTSEAEIHSPSKKAKKRGAAIALGLVKGLKSYERKITATSKSLMAKLNSTMKAATKRHNFSDSASSGIEAYKNNLSKSVTANTAIVSKAVTKAEKAARKRLAKEQKKQLKKTKSNSKKKAIRKNTAKQRKAITAWGSAVKKAYAKQIKAQQNQAIKGAEKEMNALASKYQTKYDAIAEARSTFLDRLRSYGELYSKDSYGFFKLTDFNALSKQIDVIKSGLQKLQKWGVSQNFINQITQMDPSQQKEFLSHLIALGKKGATDYAKTFDAYWKKAGDVSTSIYKPYVDALDTQYNKELAKVMAKLKKKMDEIGKQTSKGLVNGLKDKGVKKQLNKAAASLAKIMVDTIKKKLKIKSPSRVMENMMMYVGKGMVKGLEGSERGVANAMDNLVQLPTVRVPEMKSAVGAELSSEYSYGTSVEYTINVPLEINGKQFAEATASSMEDVLNKRQVRMNRRSGIR